MNNPALPHQLSASEWEPKYPFDLVVAYEDTVTRNRALHLYDHLAQELLDDYDFQCSWWKFDHLANPTLRQQSADSAAEANMIILSLHAHRDMPPNHKAWIESWLPKRDGRKSALVTLVTGSEMPEKDNTVMLTYLHRVARAGKMDFFPHGFDLPRAQRDHSAQQIAEQARVSTPLVPEIFQHRMPVPRWGINE